MKKDRRRGDTNEVLEIWRDSFRSRQEQQSEFKDQSFPKLTDFKQNSPIVPANFQMDFKAMLKSITRLVYN